jgi:hypothetical protein
MHKLMATVQATPILMDDLYSIDHEFELQEKKSYVVNWNYIQEATQRIMKQNCRHMGSPNLKNYICIFSISICKFNNNLQQVHDLIQL